MESKPILYTYYRSSCSWRLRIALALKGIDYDSRPIQFVEEEEFQKLNPLKQVPIFIINGKTLRQSVAVLEFMEEMFPEPALLPNDPFEKAKVREIVELINSGIQPITNPSVTDKHSDDENDKTKWRNYWITRGFKALENILEKTAGEYSVGNTLTLADVFLVPQVANTFRWNIDISPFPIISALNARLSTLKPFSEAHFSKQPDCPADLRS